MKQAYAMVNSRLFSSGIAPSFADIPDVLKVNYTEEFNQGLSDEEKELFAAATVVTYERTYQPTYHSMALMPHAVENSRM